MAAKPRRAIHSKLQMRRSNRIHVDDIPQIVHIRQNKIVLMRGGSFQRRGIRNAFYIRIVFAQELVGAIFYPRSYVGIRRTSIRWVVFKSAIFRADCATE